MRSARTRCSKVMAHLNTALIGVGAWGKVLAKAAGGSSKIEFSCCVGRNPERLAAFSRDTGIPACDIESVLADKAIAAVVLALPNELHFEFARRAAAAGKHVYIEKPVANTMTDSLAIAALEAAHGSAASPSRSGGSSLSLAPPTSSAISSSSGHRDSLSSSDRCWVSA